MKIFDDKKERRFYAKVVIGSPIYKTVYYRNDMKPGFFFRWKWYFDYRAALAKVQNPKININYSTGHYEHVLPRDDYKQKIRNKYIGAKANVTKARRNLQRMKDNWSQLFPIEEHPNYPKMLERLQYHENKFNEYQKLWLEIQEEPVF